MNLIMSGAIGIVIYAGRPGRTFDPRVRNLHVNGTNNNHAYSKASAAVPRERLCARLAITGSI